MATKNGKILAAIKTLDAGECLAVLRGLTERIRQLPVQDTEEYEALMDNLDLACHEDFELAIEIDI